MTFILCYKFINKLTEFVEGNGNNRKLLKRKRKQQNWCFTY